jgi:hypothetical protein
VISPSFLISDREHTEYKLIDLAVRTRVVISAVDARGVHTNENGSSEGNVPGEFSDGTGGIFFHNNNDVEEGVRRTTTGPEFTYVLGFSPTDLKNDGRYHSLKIRIIGREKLSVSGRGGYFEPKSVGESAQIENDEISNAVFSRDEATGLPIQLRTQFIKADQPVARLTVSTLADLRELPHQNVNGHYETSLRIVAAVFDRNGKYLSEIDKRVQVIWTLDKEEVRTVAKCDIILDSGAYLVRLVVRESHAHLLFAQSSPIVIP